MSDFPLPNTNQDLTGQVALVTGATAGLGDRFACVLAAAGAHVVVTGRRVDRLETLAADIQAAGGSATPIALDVSDAESIASVVAEATERCGPVQILVNNAGVVDAQRAHKMDVELVDHVLGVNLRGPYLMSIEVAKRLIATDTTGRIVNISSVGAFNYGGQGAALYSITKAGVVRMTETLAVEWARHHINVNAIAPGAFASEMMDGMLSRMGDITQGFPRGRLGDPAQLDSTLLYLCAPASEFVTGTIIKVDDGQGPR